VRAVRAQKEFSAMHRQYWPLLTRGPIAILVAGP